MGYLVKSTYGLMYTGFIISQYGSIFDTILTVPVKEFMKIRKKKSKFSLCLLIS
jgi:hypothetical protein